MGRLPTILGSALRRLVCIVDGHDFLPFPEDPFAPLRCHRCGYRVGW